MGRIRDVYIKEVVSAVSMATMSKPAEAKKPQTSYPDPRFSSPDFRQKVRTVLTWLGEPVTYAAFQKWTQWGMNWQAQFKQLTDPEHLAQCYILDGNGSKIYITDERRYASCLLSLPGWTKDEAIKNLDTTKYEFRRWWGDPLPERKGA